MRATFTEEQETLRSAARGLADGGRSAARAVLDGGELPGEPTASLMSGFSGLAVPEADGGAGGDLVDLAIVLRALGATVTPTPWVSHVLAVQVVHAAGLDVSAAAGGTRRLALGVDETGAARGGWATTVTPSTVEGTKVAVRDGGTADSVVVVGADDAVAVCGAGQREGREAFDPTRPLADVRLEGAPEQHGTGAGSGVRRATAALAAELVGVGGGVVDLAVEHAKVREQFGQPIGRFQGVAHQLADAWVGVELAWSLTLHACWAVHARDDDAARATHAAKAKAGEAAVHAAERSTQVHGGIGITWEADPHLYLRRALADDQWLGPARHHRRRLGEAVVDAHRGRMS